MIIRKAFKFRLKTNNTQKQKLSEFAGCCRFVWNKALAINLDRLNNKQHLLWYQEQAYWLTLWKQSDDYGFLKDCHSQPLQQKLKDLERAFKDGFDSKQPLKRIPKFKKKGLGDSFRYPAGFKVENGKVFLPKIGWVKYRNSREIVGKVKNVTVSLKGGHWYVSIQSEQEIIPTHPSTSMIGIDLGITRFVTMSDGSFVEPLNSFRKLESRLAREQRKLSRKVRFSSNWRKQKSKITRIHERITNSRKDFLHKTSSEISKNHATIVVEDLKVKNMSKSAKGSEETHGKNVAAKSGLNKSILDQGWGMFVDMVTYKQLWAGGELLKVNPKYTSQTCPACQHVSRENRQTQLKFECVECGYTNNADVVGAINVKERGHRLLACGETALAA